MGRTACGKSAGATERHVLLPAGMPLTHNVPGTHLQAGHQLAKNSISTASSAGRAVMVAWMVDLFTSSCDMPPSAPAAGWVLSAAAPSRTKSRGQPLAAMLLNTASGVMVRLVGGCPGGLQVHPAVGCTALSVTAALAAMWGFQLAVG